MFLISTSEHRWKWIPQIHHEISMGFGTLHLILVFRTILGNIWMFARWNSTLNSIYSTIENENRQIWFGGVSNRTPLHFFEFSSSIGNCLQRVNTKKSSYSTFKVCVTTKVWCGLRCISVNSLQPNSVLNNIKNDNFRRWRVWIVHRFHYLVEDIEFSCKFFVNSSTEVSEVWFS